MDMYSITMMLFMQVSYAQKLFFCDTLLKEYNMGWALLFPLFLSFLNARLFAGNCYPNIFAFSLDYEVVG
jgi:hypothetical protein